MSPKTLTYNPYHPKVVLFDWGDTLMTLFPDYRGAMVDWPRVEVVPGVKEALGALQTVSTLAVATNAADSSAAQVLAALNRAGLGGYFTAVFTTHELGAAKPEPAYFEAALVALGCDPSEAVMVGDSFKIDILGAKRAGLRAIWYNPRLGAAPSMRPEQDGELAHMEDLPRLLQTLRLPDVATCRAWQADADMPVNIAAHSEAVAGAAYWMAVSLRRAGERVDPLLAHRGGLLHDLDKVKTLHQGRRHGELSHELLMARGQPELAEIARCHNMPAILDPQGGLQTWEQKLVFYADKLVEGDHLVPLAVRLEALKGRYPAYAGQIERCEPLVYGLEASLCALLGQPAGELLTELRNQQIVRGEPS
jgi:predicted HAD superfamily phosphohydrolase YqeG